MYEVFQRHKFLKLAGLILGLFVADYLVHAGVSIYLARSMSLDSLIGEYAFGNEHQISIVDRKFGKLVSKDFSSRFVFTYKEGTFDCAIDSETSFKLKVVQSDHLFCTYDNVFLYRQEAV